MANHHNRVAGRNRRILLEPGGPSLESGCRGRAVLPARLRAAPPAPRPAPVRVSRWPQLSEGETRAFHTYTHPRFLENSLI